MEKILIVDDSMLTRAILAKALSEAGYTTLEAEDSTKGLELYDKEQPNLVLTDLMMPGMDGIEFAHEIRKRNKRVPIILQSVEFDKWTKIRSEKAGINDYLFKNFDKKELIKKVKKLLA